MITVLYGSSVWFDSMRLQQSRTLINQCQRVALYACLKVCRTVSIETMQILIGGLPWDLVKRGLYYQIRNGHEVREIEQVAGINLAGLDTQDSLNAIVRNV